MLLVAGLSSYKARSIDGDVVLLVAGLSLYKARSIDGDVVLLVAGLSSYKASKEPVGDGSGKGDWHSLHHHKCVSLDFMATEEYTLYYCEQESKGYTCLQVLNCDETRLSLKNMPSRLHMAGENCLPGHKYMKDGLTLAVCSFRSSNYRLQCHLYFTSKSNK